MGWIARVVGVAGAGLEALCEDHAMKGGGVGTRDTVPYM